MRRRLATLVLLAPLASTEVFGADDDPVVIHNGFLTGEQFLKLSTSAKAGYAAGLVDGMLLSPLFGAPKAKLALLESCATGMTNTQVSAILEKFLKENPSRWHESAHTSMFAALDESCPVRAD